MPEKLNADNKLDPKELDPKELDEQLKKPKGDTGKQLALNMNKGNKHICLNSYKALNPKSGNYILEIGMGNGFFVKDLLAMAENLRYMGADFSDTMVHEARLLNKEFIDSGKVCFEQASIEKLPFKNDTFDCITTTNTLYFWPQPKSNIKELVRVLKPNGKLLIAYRTKSCIAQNHRERDSKVFQHYESEEVEGLLSTSGLSQISTQVIKEPEIEIYGDIIHWEGTYTMGIK